MDEEDCGGGHGQPRPAPLRGAEAGVDHKVRGFACGRDGETLEEAMGNHLRSKGLSLSVAESCTGGLVAHRITSVAGSSDYFLGGVVAYHNEVKEKLLGVTAPVLAEHGAVSEETARQMAAGVRRLFGSDLGVGITGVAGPGGATPAKPVGLVYIGLATIGTTDCEEHRFAGSRAEIKEQSARAALEIVRRQLQER